MRKVAGAALAVAVVTSVPFAAPAFARIPTPTESATPTPLPTDSPVPEPEPTVDPAPSPDGDGKGDNKPDRPRGHRKRDRIRRQREADANRTKRRLDRKAAKDKLSAKARAKAKKARKARLEKKAKRSEGEQEQTRVETYRIDGAFSTAELVERAAHLGSLGWSRRRVLGAVYAPFIIAGEASWIDTWGAPRYGPAPGQVRTHKGQDVFCTFGAPVLAAEPGVIEFDEQSLGGRIARLHRRDGSYFYYAHLSDWNTDSLDSGDRVRTGDVIGYCGNTGNALTTPPHVHFGLYAKDGEARNPMRYLVAWLRSAETNTRVVITRAVGKRVAEMEQITTARRFGDAFAPDRSQLKGGVPSSEGLADGGFGLVESALAVAAQDALKGEVAEDADGISSSGSEEASGKEGSAGADPAALP